MLRSICTWKFQLELWSDILLGKSEIPQYSPSWLPKMAAPSVNNKQRTRPLIFINDEIGRKGNKGAVLRFASSSSAMFESCRRTACFSRSCLYPDTAGVGMAFVEVAILFSDLLTNWNEE